MAHWRTAFRTRVNAAIGPAFFDWGKRPDASNLPAATGEVTADPVQVTHDGEQGLRMVRVQIDCWSDLDVVEAVEMADTIKALIHTEPADPVDGIIFERGFCEGPLDFGAQEADRFVYRQRLDAVLWYKPAA